MFPILKKLLPVIILVLINFFNVYSQSISNRKLRVATKEAVPFVMKEKDGSWSGISIDLWERMAASMGVQYEYVEYPLYQIMDSVSAGKVDLAVGAFTISEERELISDFTYPYYVAGHAIATKARGTGIFDFLDALFSMDFLKVVGSLLLILLFFGFLVWLFERKDNPHQFGGHPLKGIGAGFWWSAVTMTTVGYGDKAPVTAAGRFIALLWMFMALIIISSFTAAIASSLTMEKMSSFISDPDDLRRVKVGTVQASSTESYLNDIKIQHYSFQYLEDALDALEDDDIDAVVYDEPILRYLITERKESNLVILPHQLQQLYYGFPVPANSPLRETLNIHMLKIIHHAKWDHLLFNYLGDSEK